jgi:exosome complex exonuclease DIS3/RRP44
MSDLDNDEHVQYDDASNDDDDDSEMEDDDAIVMTAPSLYTRRSFFRQTRKRGKILKQAREDYLRDDLGLGCQYVEEHGGGGKRRKGVDKVVGQPKVIETVETLVDLLLQSVNVTQLVVVDANVLIHNLDVLEAAPHLNLVVPQTSLMECRKNRVGAYDRTVDLLRTVQPELRRCIFIADMHHCETAFGTASDELSTANDQNDARIRNVAEFYARQLQGTNIQVIFLTDDAASRKLASKKSYQALSVREWAQLLERQTPGLNLMDWVAHFESSSSAQTTDRDIFPAHIDSAKLSHGVAAGSYFRGTFRRTSAEDAMVTIRKGDEMVAVSIQNHLGNRALNGDVVAIALNPLDQWIAGVSSAHIQGKESESAAIASDTAEPKETDMENIPEAVYAAGKSLRPTGKVVGILRRNFSNQSGSIYSATAGGKKIAESLSEKEKIAEEQEREHSDGSCTCVFFPVDRKMEPVLIRTTQRDRLLGQRIIVSIDSWPANSRYPLGHYVRTLGPVGSKDVETEVLLLEHDIPHEPFPASVLACLPPEDYKIDTANSPGREDLRHLPVLSIDPPGCQDIDDALHCIKLPNGNYQVGVHIADVTHYVKAGSAIDLEAANRSTSTYLVNKRIDMLPKLLTTDLCSLKGNVDRYAFSVIWEVTPETEIVNVDFKKTIIHSIAALTYQQAQSMIDQPDDPKDTQACAVKGLTALARKLRQRRIDAGALTLASPEVKFVLDSESLNPTDVQAYALLEANSVVEEFMLFANVTVSKKILRQYPTLSVLRRHPAPNRAMFDGLIGKARSLGLALDIEDSKRLADSLDVAQVESDPYINKLLRILSTRCMSPAQYFSSADFRPSEWHHYGLAAPVYTHFTSPIRRYADICVHRLLAASINVAPLPLHLSSKSYLHELCANMNRRHRAAQLAGRASVQLHTLIFFAGDGAREEDAYVLDVSTEESSEPACRVIVPRFGIESKVKLGVDPEDSNLCRDPANHKLTYGKDDAAVSVHVFQKVKVRIWVREFEDHQRELVVDLIQPCFDRKDEAASNSSKRPSSEATKKTKKPKKS